MRHLNRDLRLGKTFGCDEFDLIDRPAKIGSRKLARILHAREQGGCTYCFPHGPETTNSTASKKRRSWKYHRKTRHQG